MSSLPLPHSTRIGLQTFAASSPVMTRRTPGILSASRTSTDLMRACACWLRTKATLTVSGSLTSSTYWARPSRYFGSSSRFTDAPKGRTVGIAGSSRRSEDLMLDVRQHAFAEQSKRIHDVPVRQTRELRLHDET